MQKNELRKLRALPATKEMMEKGKQLREEVEIDYWTRKKRIIMLPKYDYLCRVQNLSGYIKIALFLPEKLRAGIKTPRYEIFLNIKGNEWITRILNDAGQEEKWSTAMVFNLEGIQRYYWGRQREEAKVYINSDARATLNTLELEKNKGKTGIERLAEWQQCQRNEKIRMQEEREQAVWDADMKLIPELTDAMKEWMRRNVDNTYIFYEYDRKGAKTGYCSKCRKYVPIKNPKHGSSTMCPSCRTKAFFKARKKIQTTATEGYFCIIQPFKDGIVIKRVHERQAYRDRPYEEPKIWIGETERILMFNNGIIRAYRWDMYKNKKLRWIQETSNKYQYRQYYGNYYWSNADKLYRRNLPQLKKYTMLKYSALDLWEKLPCSVQYYLVTEKGNPAIEKLARLGMFTIAKDMLEEEYAMDLMEQKETELARMLRLDKERLRRLKEMDGNIYSLHWMQYEKEANTIWPDEMIKDFGEAEFNLSSFNFLNPEKKYSFTKCYNYLKKQAKMAGETIDQTLITWRDYINMAEQERMNTALDQIARPKDLKAAHDELILIRETRGLEKQAEKLEKKWTKVNSQLPKLKKFEFTLGEYQIKAPESILDIVKEGTILRHCVHTCDYYFDRIQRDESYLFFLRHSKQPDMPWYTLEVEPSGNIRQKRTTGDNQNKDFEEAIIFLKKWQQFFKKQLTKEEKKQGEKANQLRLKEYEKLRKDGNKVWHGKLAGKLLADVLEEDFMEAL
jgi:DNA-directed RNA polymerase subunit RPC12/RpoP